MENESRQTFPIQVLEGVIFKKRTELSEEFSLAQIFRDLLVSTFEFLTMLVPDTPQKPSIFLQMFLLVKQPIFHVPVFLEASNSNTTVSGTEMVICAQWIQPSHCVEIFCF